MAWLGDKVSGWRRERVELFILSAAHKRDAGTYLLASRGVVGLSVCLSPLIPMPIETASLLICCRRYEEELTTVTMFYNKTSCLHQPSSSSSSESKTMINQRCFEYFSILVDEFLLFFFAHLVLYFCIVVTVRAELFIWIFNKLKTPKYTFLFIELCLLGVQVHDISLFQQVVVREEKLTLKRL